MSKSPLKPEEPALDRTELVESLADIAKRLDLSEIEYQTGDLKIRVARQMTTTMMQVSAPATSPSWRPATMPGLLVTSRAW